MSKNIREGDTVLILCGNDKGKTGEVLNRSTEKVLVQGINVKKKHIKKSEQNPNGGIVELEAPVHISNVQLCNEKGKPIKAKRRVNPETKAREIYYVDSGKEVLYRPVKAKKK